MNKLEDVVIHAMAIEFIIHLSDKVKRTLVDQLGRHPVNHARFARYLTQFGHANDWLAYLDLTNRTWPDPVS